MQFGFSPSRGTTHSLAIASELIAHNKTDNGQYRIVLRDSTKAFDKVYLGMKYKILHLDIPVILEKLLCAFLEDRRARIRFGTFLGENFELQCGFPQGRVLSSTMFITYTHDIPPPIRGSNVSYADDISQIVGYPGRSIRMAQRATARETNY